MRIRFSTLITGMVALTLSHSAYGQAPKPGLYDVTNHMTWQKSPFPESMHAAPGSDSPHTAETCLTQAQIEKYNGPKPEAHGECQVSNIHKREKGMTAEITCTGNMKGKGTVESIWTDAEHSKSKVHFTGAMQMGPTSKPVEWTLESDSTYKGPNCGSIKPTQSEE